MLPRIKPALSQNELLEQFTDYCFQLFSAPIALEEDIPVSGIIYSSMKAKGYISSTGRCRYTKRLYEDITDFYNGIDLQYRITFTQLQRALLENLREFTTITQIAFFLGISVEDLAEPTVTDTEVSGRASLSLYERCLLCELESLDNEPLPFLKSSPTIYITV